MGSDAKKEGWERKGNEVKKAQCGQALQRLCEASAGGSLVLTQPWEVCWVEILTHLTVEEAEAQPSYTLL